MVNSQAKEKVYNKKDVGYTGCNLNPYENPTCGSVKFNDVPIPYSSGFCCSCDDTIKNQHMGKITNSENPNFYRSFKNPPAFTKNPLNSYDVPEFNKNKDGFNTIGGKLQDPLAMSNLPNIMENDGNYSRTLRKANDQKLMGYNEKWNRIQKRGGQNCSDKYTPPNVDANSYHDSTHCLQFSDVWYSVYRLDRPTLHHYIQIQVYEKYQDLESDCKWRDLTKKSPVVVGTNVLRYSNEQNTLTVNYMAREGNENMFSLNYKIHKLLVPDTSDIVNASIYPETQGGPPEYLVVKENQVNSNGKTCNVAGVGYEAFSKQPSRCSVSKGSCLKNQPMNMWQHDHELDMTGKKGCYFLKFFALLPDEPIKYNSSCQNLTLQLYYTESHTSVLDIELKADSNIILRPNSLAVITEVFVDSSSSKKTFIIAKVFNSGLISGVFLVSMTDCPLDLPASFSNINSKPALIAPQHQHTFNLEIECPLPVYKFVCSLQVLNVKQELIALRKIRLQKLDRCICIWHCSCVCLIADIGLKCRPLSLESYHASGFQGGLPIPLHIVHYTFMDDMVSLMLYILLFLCLTLLIMGLTKAIIGCFLISVGLWGLDIIYDLPKKMHNYYESEINHRPVIYDENGWPIHPDTRDKVRNIPFPAEFCTNLMFFIIYPFAVICAIVRRICFSSDVKRKQIDGDDGDYCQCRNGKLVKRKNSSLQNSLIKKSSSLLKSN